MVYDQSMLRKRLGAGALLLLGSFGCGGPSRDVSPPASGVGARGNTLRSPDSFVGIGDKDDRARAIFVEASRVMLHPRCKNCHPAGDSPAQGDDGRVHDPPVLRGPHDEGVAALECSSCHQDKNVELARVPGAPKWHLAPIEMAWVDKTPRTLCEQLKDPKRNGGKSIDQIVEHSGHDELVAWGWAPGHGRTPAPGTQTQFGALMTAWAQAGAACPKDEVKR